MQPPPRKTQLCIFIPSSLTLGNPEPRLKILKIAQVARAAAIFRVNQIAIYRDAELDDSKLIKLVLDYLETPQYLRKQLFRKLPELRYIGLAPPLRTPHHPIKSKPSPGDYREGIMLDRNHVDIGLDSVASCLGRAAPPGTRVTAKILELDPLKVELVDPSSVPHYWGYSTSIFPSLSKALEQCQHRIIFTAKEGKLVSFQDLSSLRNLDLGVVFGSPSRGIQEILAQEGRDYREFSDQLLNFIPNQGTATVRTEEAIYSVLSILNFYLDAQAI